MPKVACITLAVTDMDLAIDFYCNKLGFEIATKEWYPEVVALQHEGFPIVLSKAAESARYDYPNVSQTVMGLHTANVDETLAELKAKGVDLVHSTPQPFPVGRFFAVRDPFGNVIELLQFDP